jgi:hypothetical protein
VLEDAGICTLLRNIAGHFSLVRLKFTCVDFASLAIELNNIFFRSKCKGRMNHDTSSIYIHAYKGCRIIIIMIIIIIILVYLRAQLNSQRPITKLAHDTKIYKEIQKWNASTETCKNDNNKTK